LGQLVSRVGAVGAFIVRRKKAMGNDPRSGQRNQIPARVIPFSAILVKASPVRAILVKASPVRAILVKANEVRAI
jgi:hypothetical protein